MVSVTTLFLNISILLIPSQNKFTPELTFERDPSVAPWSMGDRKSLQTKKYVTCRVNNAKEGNKETDKIEDCIARSSLDSTVQRSFSQEI